MAVSINVSGNYKSNFQHVYVTSIWKSVLNCWIFNGPLNTWKPMYSYNWEIGAWGNCSATCGGGTQTRTVRCKRNDDVYVNDVYCLSS